MDGLLVGPGPLSDPGPTTAVGFASTVLGNKFVMMVGATYDIEMINAIEYLITQGKLQRGDKVGHVYLEGEYGTDALLGSKYAGLKEGLTIVEQKITAADQDLTPQVTSFKAAGVKAMLLSTTPTQAASAVAVAASLAFNVPTIGDGPTYVPQLMKTAAANALEKNFLLVLSQAPFSTDLPAAKEVAAAYKAKYPDEVPQYAVDYGYAIGEVHALILQRACTNGDLSRNGIANAWRGLSNADTGGLLPTLDYAKAGAPPTREVLIAKPDPTVDGGLTAVQLFFVSDLAKQYKAPAEA